MGSTRTPEQKDVVNARQRGIDQAWERERAYVQMGMGTRDWTPEEQRELLETGRVEGYKAHHMSSVSADPVNASNPDNIQFLTYDEHLAAHGGKWTNATNGRYDPQTGQTHTFEDGKIEAPEASALSNPLCDTLNTDGVMTDAIIWDYTEAVDAHLGRAERKVMKSDHLTDEQKQETIAALRENAENNKQTFIESMEKADREEKTGEAAGRMPEAMEL